MQMMIKGVSYYYQWLFEPYEQRPTLICLHGFTGSSQTFLPIFTKEKKYNILVIDLIGHGKSSSFVHPYHYQFTTVCEAVIALAENLGLASFSLFGYSMGARVALGIACRFPQKIDHLILESGSPGLEKVGERQARQKNDQHLAQFILQHSLTEFVDTWENLPLFATQKCLAASVQKLVRTERLGQTKFGLLCSLWFMGTGVQPSFWDQLTQLTGIPMLLLTGALDPKFVAISERMKLLQPQAELLVVENAGHCVHIEQPEIVEKAVSSKMLEGVASNGNISN